MTSRLGVNRRIVLARRPHGAPVLDDFRMEETAIPPVPEGSALLRTLYLSLDPYMRGRMNEGASYAEPVAVGGTMCGQAVCRVELSNASGLKIGDCVLAGTGWQEFAVLAATQVTKLDQAFEPVTHALGVLGMPGLTAYVGLLDIGRPKPGETLVVAAATGAVGSIVGQVAKLKGCRVVGVAGGLQKCEFAVRTLGFDACVDHHDPNLGSQLAESCPQGIDIYFENVGGAVFDAVLPLLNVQARVPLCGLISSYNATEPPQGNDRTPLMMRTVLVRRIKLQGFIISDHYDRRPDFIRDMTRWLQSSCVRYREDVIDGLENAPLGLIGLLRGENFGKSIVRVDTAGRPA
jgi:NADPH-dependent curcumin reductase